MKAYEARAMLKALDVAGFLPVAMLIISIGAAWLAGSEVKSALNSIRQIQINQAVRAEIQKLPLSEDDYKVLIQSLARLHPMVNISAEKGKVKGMRVEISNAAAYSEWMQTLSVVHARQPGVIWEVKEFCVGRCGNAAASALIEGIRQSASVKED